MPLGPHYDKLKQNYVKTYVGNQVGYGKSQVNDIRLMICRSGIAESLNGIGSISCGVLRIPDSADNNKSGNYDSRANLFLACWYCCTQSL
eukprot:6159751-Amphidinium_carterae.1